jgi:hypothetical protein
LLECGAAVVIAGRNEESFGFARHHRSGKLDKTKSLAQLTNPLALLPVFKNIRWASWLRISYRSRAMTKPTNSTRPPNRAASGVRMLTALR